MTKSSEKFTELKENIKLLVEQQQVYELNSLMGVFSKKCRSISSKSRYHDEVWAATETLVAEGNLTKLVTRDTTNETQNIFLFPKGTVVISSVENATHS